MNNYSTYLTEITKIRIEVNNVYYKVFRLENVVKLRTLNINYRKHIFSLGLYFETMLTNLINWNFAMIRGPSSKFVCACIINKFMDKRPAKSLDILAFSCTMKMNRILAYTNS